MAVERVVIAGVAGAGQIVFDRSEALRLVLTLFTRWALSSPEQAALLAVSLPTLRRYRHGGLPRRRATWRRIGVLLGMHALLHTLYPWQPELRYAWIRRRNVAFAGMRPLDVMCAEGPEPVWRYLEGLALL